MCWCAIKKLLTHSLMLPFCWLSVWKWRNVGKTMQRASSTWYEVHYVFSQQLHASTTWNFLAVLYFWTVFLAKSVLETAITGAGIPAARNYWRSQDGPWSWSTPVTLILPWISQSSVTKTDLYGQRMLRRLWLCTDDSYDDDGDVVWKHCLVVTNTVYVENTREIMSVLAAFAVLDKST